ncbi:beta-ketoacyl synthase N-terminal-like domain-containing protein [Streptomyces sp. NPDC058045]|uniref:beta-ketoacyl synthase N-terminal-like domain-containing protein n=1 Tax=Streptomyces sp. NPDC058045 TaxID=3346311 RepID=UPI0036E40562
MNADVNGAAPLAAITGIGPVSRVAIGVEELGACTLPYGTDPEDAGAGIQAMDNFDPAEHLGKRGWKFLPPVTRAALAAVRLATADAGEQPERPPERTGVVIGTNFGVDEIVERIDLALLKDGISGISAVECPNFSLNVPASQVSIAHGMKAFNITLANLLTAGYEALLSGGRALRAGRADAVLAGAIEGRPPLALQTIAGTPLDAAGACLLHLEAPEAAMERGARVYGWLTGGRRGVLSDEPGSAQRTLFRTLDALGGPPPASVHLCLPVGEAGTAALRTEEDTRRWADGLGTTVTVTRGAPQATVTSVLALARHLVRSTSRVPVAAGGTGPEGPGEGDAVFGVLGPQGHTVFLRVSSERGPA